MRATLVLSAALVLLLAGLLFVPRGGALGAVAWTFDLSRPDEGVARVRAEFSGLRGPSLELSGLLADRLLRVGDLRATDERGRVLLVEVLPGSAAGAELGFARRRIALPHDADVVIIEYSVRTSTYSPPNGDPEERHLGVIGTDGCALALANLVLMPDEPLARAELEVRFPTGWSASVALPAHVEPLTADAAWPLALVAGPRPAERVDLGARLALSTTRALSERDHAGLRAAVAELERLFGPPRVSLEIHALPHATDGLTTELPGTVTAIACDVRGADPASIRRLVRALVPRWFERSSTEIELDPSPDAWFALGLSDLLAARLATAARACAGDPTAGIESTWIREIDLHALDIEQPTDGALPTQTIRRVMAQAFLIDLDHALAPHGGLDAALRVWNGRGYPRFEASDPRAAILERFVSERIRNHRRALAFEERWKLELSAVPSERPAGARVARVLRIAYTSDTQGFLETCGCKLSQEGGVARQARALADLRVRDPSALVLDLGEFAPLEPRRPNLDALVEAEGGIYLEALAAMRYDAVCVGPSELLCGSRRVRATAREIGLPLVSGLIRAGDEELGPITRIIEKDGLRIGVLGWSEHIDHGFEVTPHEAHLREVCFERDVESVVTRARELSQRADLVVIIGRMRPANLRRLAASGARIDLVLVGDAWEFVEPEATTTGFLGRTAVATATANGRGIDEIELFLSQDNRPIALNHTLIRLPRDAPVDSGVQGLLDRFYAAPPASDAGQYDTKQLFAWDELQRDDYVGAAACVACHPAEHAQWQATPHARAMETLVAARRDRHAKCVACHVVGLGTETGYRMERPDTRFAGVQCEICHGAGGDHSRAPAHARMRRTPEKRTCLECHDEEHSESFEARFEDMLQAVKHP